MRKEEILSKSRAEGKDEMEVAVNNRAYYWGTMTLILVCVFFACIKIFLDGQPFYEFPAILFAFNAGMNTYNYLKLRSKRYLALAILSIFIFVSMMIMYFLNR